MKRHCAIIINALLMIAGFSQASVLAAVPFNSLDGALQYKISEDMGKDEASFHFRKDGEIYTAQTTAEMRGALSKNGLTLQQGQYRWSVALNTIERAGESAPFSRNINFAALDKNRLTFSDNSVSEWYVNGPYGLQQGWTIVSRASGTEGITTLILKTGGNLVPCIQKDRRGISLNDEMGNAVFYYRGLYAYDANKKELHAWFEAKESALAIYVDDRGAAYPITVDPWAQSAELTASDKSASDYLGRAVAMSSDGSTIVAGASYSDTDGTSNSGSIYVYVKPGGGWATATQSFKLYASDKAVNDYFPSSIAISSDGSTIVAGKTYATVGGFAQAGALYVFERGAGWANGSGNQTAKLTPSDPKASADLGWSIAISANGTTIVGGANYANAGATASAGALYVYEMGAGWADRTENYKLTASDAEANGYLGASVGIDPEGTTIAGGAWCATISGNNDAGAVYVFEKGAGWAGGSANQTAKLTTSDVAANDWFSNDQAGSIGVSSNGSTISVGCYKKNAVYVFLEGGGWASRTQDYKLTASDSASLQSSTITPDGSVIVSGSTSKGKAYVFAKGASWANGSGNQSAILTPADLSGFGQTVGLSSDGLSVVSGSWIATIGGVSNCGALYVFTNPPVVPTVTTQAATGVGTATATGNGNITATGGQNATIRGFCWNTAGNPTTADSKTAENGSFGTGAFTGSITGLTAGTTYYVKAYATNSAGTAYGAEQSFTTADGVTASAGTASYILSGAAAAVDPGIVVAGGNITDFKVTITGNFASGDTLAYTGVLPGGISAANNAAAGILTFTGTTSAANWQTLLRTVTFGTTSASTATRTVSFTLGNAIPYEGNNHFYKYVTTNTTWANAKTAAAAAGSTLYGLQGYLATITSQEENNFIREKLGADAWIGASDAFAQINACAPGTYADQAAAEGNWYWVTGPEACTQFSSGNTNPAAVGGHFMYWNTGEPNNCCANGEHYGEIYSSGADPGKWNDLGPFDSLAGYVVEYGGMTGDPVVQITAGRNVTVQAVAIITTTTTMTPGADATVCSFSISPSVGSFSAAGGTGSFSMSTGSSCVWSVYTGAAWITVINPSGDTTGSATVSYTVGANTEAQIRYGQITAGGQEYTVVQEASAGGATTTSTIGTTTTTIQGNVTTTTTVSEDVSTTTTAAENPDMAGAADFVGSPLSGDAPVLVKFINTYKGDDVQREWDFGDGSTSTEAHPEHTYRTPGSYSVVLTVTGDRGSDTMTKKDYITITQAPALLSNFSAAPALGTAPLEVSFTDNSKGAVSTWLWNFGDNGTSIEQNPVHTYGEAGLYTVTLTVSGEAGLVNTLEKVNCIRVSGLAPEAAFEAAPMQGPAPLSVSFTDTSKGFATGRQWNFGDGKQAGSRNPVHVYTVPGTYTVSLTVSAPGGETTETKTGYIVVSEPEEEKPLRYSIRGTLTGEGIQSIEILLTGRNVQRKATSGKDGTYSFAEVPVGAYSVTPSTKGFAFDPVSREVTLTQDDISGLDFTVMAGEPVLQVLYASPPSTPADGTTPITLLAKVSHQLGLLAIKSVAIDLTAIGGQAGQQMYDNGTNGDETAADGVFSFQTVIAQGTDPGLQMLKVRASDTAGNDALGVLAVGVSLAQAGEISPCGSFEGSIEVARHTKELLITVSVDQAASAGLVVEVFRPSGREWRRWETFAVMENQTEYRVKNPGAGLWKYRITQACEPTQRVGTVYRAKSIPLTVQSVLKGIGSVSGRITDAQTGQGIGKALVKIGRYLLLTDESGYYAGTLRAGVYRMKVKACGHFRLVNTVIIDESKNTVMDAVINKKFWIQYDALELEQDIK